MEQSKNGNKRKPGRRTVVDRATNIVKCKLNDAEYAKFTERFYKSGLNTKTDFIKHLLFEKEIRVVTFDKNTKDYYMRLTNLYAQYRAIGVNYNQTVKALHINFSEAKAKILIDKQITYLEQLIRISEKIATLTREFKKYFEEKKMSKLEVIE